MKYDLRIAIPFLLAAAAAATQALLTELTNYHPSTATGALIVALALPVGDFIRAQIAIAQKNEQPQAQPAELVSSFSGGGIVHGEAVALPALPVVDPELLVDLVEDALRQHLAKPSATMPVGHPAPTVGPVAGQPARTSRTIK